MKTLVIYYSQTGNSRKVAQLLASKLNAETAEITCDAYKRGFTAGLRLAWDILVRGKPPIETPNLDLNQYDLIVAGGPVWAGHPAAPLRSFVSKLGSQHKTALFLTCNGTSKSSPGEKALDELSAAAPMAPIAVRLFKEAEIASPELQRSVAAFAAALEPQQEPARAAAG